MVIHRGYNHAVYHWRTVLSGGHLRVGGGGFVTVAVVRVRGISSMTSCTWSVHKITNMADTIVLILPH